LFRVEHVERVGHGRRLNDDDVEVDVDVDGGCGGGGGGGGSGGSRDVEFTDDRLVLVLILRVAVVL
jgi:hypothetical protein